MSNLIGGRFRGVPNLKSYVIVMINTCESTRRINSFKFVAIPSPRDVFARYGERLSNRGEYTSRGEEVTPSMVSASSTIDQIINAQKLLEIDSNIGTK